MWFRSCLLSSCSGLDLAFFGWCGSDFVSFPADVAQITFCFHFGVFLNQSIGIVVGVNYVMRNEMFVFG